MVSQRRSHNGEGTSVDVTEPADFLGNTAADLFDLHGRTALVSGASRGIGRGAARILDSAGARVAFCGRDVAALAETKSLLKNDPLAVSADLSQRDGAARLAEQVLDATGGVDILINNAGVQVVSPALTTSEQDWDFVQDVNLRSVFLLCQALAPQMIQSGWGKIVNVASVLGMVADRNASSYITSKAGMLGLTRALASEWAASGVTVNALCPGWIETEMVEDVRQMEGFDRRVRGRTPLRRWGTVGDLDGAFLFLSSPASDFVAGHALVVDGGLTSCW
jgi:NAD(P)-dependent dehydrogenase (short-subunit alcohol dehydrogenase family)